MKEYVSSIANKLNEQKEYAKMNDFEKKEYRKKVFGEVKEILRDYKTERKALKNKYNQERHAENADKILLKLQYNVKLLDLQKKLMNKFIEIKQKYFPKTHGIGV